MPPAFYLSFCKKKKENTLFFVWPKSLENIEKKIPKKREREFTCLNHRQNFCFRLKRLASNGAHTKEFSFISLNFFLFVNFSIYVGCEERPWLLISHNKWSQHNWEFFFLLTFFDIPRSSRNNWAVFIQIHCFVFKISA